MNAPKLRFKEFNDEWEKTNIKNVCNVIGGGTPDTNNLSYWNGDIQWFTPSEIGKTKYISKSERTITDLGFKNSSAKMLPKGAILLTSRATIGEASILLNEACTNQGFQSLIANKNIDNEFIFYSKELFKNEMYKKAFGSTFLEISKSNIEKIEISIPSLEEQNKISKFISLLDKKIELQSKKIEALKLYKLSQIRDFFKNNNFGSCKLKDIGQFISSNSIGKEKITNTGVPLILYGDLYTKYNETIQDIKQFCNDNEKYVKSELNDLIFPTSTTVDAISLISPSSVKVKGAVYGGDIIIFKPNIKDINSDFLSFEINNYLKKYFSTFAQGSTIIHIQADNLLNCNVLLPNIKIQTKLANCFNLYNKKIKLEEEKLSKLESLKKGLMQSMFV